MAKETEEEKYLISSILSCQKQLIERGVDITVFERDDLEYWSIKGLRNYNMKISLDLWRLKSESQEPMGK